MSRRAGRKPFRLALRPWLLLLALGLLGVSTGLSAQQPPVGEEVEEAGEPSAPLPDLTSPHLAYADGLYDRALQGFVDKQVERPNDPELALNIGAAHYRMRDYEAAAQAFRRAAVAGAPELRGQALYNLGNTAYRQGRLEEAIGYYQAALDVAPDDEDAKFNLEFVRDEIRRRHEEAQKRQQEQQGDQGREQQQQQQGGGGQDQQQEQQQEGQDQQPEQGDPGQPEESAGGQEQSPDQDGDGLPDETERSGANPTDPANPDTDADGLLDGEEDRNRNGAVDPGETDPNLADSDGDGTPDGEESPAGQAAAAEAEGSPEGMTPEEAERYLQALEEGRPEERAPRTGRRLRPEKDW